jgi:ABC-type spermidine/putrescine transport system permease subunit I
MPRSLQPVLVMAVFLPFLTAFLIRIYAWINILQREGLLNDALMALGLIRQPLVWLSTDTAIIIGIVYSYLPFMILPLYATPGRRWTRRCWKPPRSRRVAGEGVLAGDVPAVAAGRRAGALLCFIPIAGEFVIPDLLAARVMIGRRCGWNSSPTRTGRWPPRRGRAAGAAGGAAPALRPAAAPQLEGGDAQGQPDLAVQRHPLALGLAFLYLPIVILVIYSFNASRLVTVWGGWSLRWYGASTTARCWMRPG